MLSNYRHLREVARQYISGERGNVFQNIAWLFFEHISRMAFGLVIGAWVARYLGAEQFGILNYAIAFIGLFSPLANLGLDSLVIRTVVHEPELKDQILGTTFWLKLLSSLLCCGLVLGAIFWIRSEDLVIIQVVAILATASIFQAFDVVDFWFRSQVQSKFTVIAKNSVFLLITGFKVLLVIWKAPLITFAWVMFAETSLGAIALIGMYRFRGYDFSLAWSLDLAKRLLKESWPLILSGLSVMIYMKIDLIMLGEMVGDEAVGLYAAAIKLSEIWYFIPTAITASVAPSIYAAKKNDELSYNTKIEKLIRLLVQLSLILAVPISIFSMWIIPIIYGQEYSQSGIILSIHIWASLFVFMGVASSPWFIAENLTHLSFLRTFLGAIINLFLNYLLIPSYAGVGAALATVISQAVASYLSNGLTPVTRPIFNLQSKAYMISIFLSSS
ncbi:flippase [[Limnothrix rosea] IAM M-220]|uniref:flippase n=1 Tax=[Limnothrix rosea] IAM M-220 TaxID=454133 RepID=UPI00095B110B|nr:flippase [[Limnothrix rosea] IAM M-220]OKH11239.1 O-unit flippase [[Limnothrix rosea] IAM M-220]